VIHFDVAYLRPESVAEAVEAYAEAAGKGQHPVYYAGGTEITTFCRTGKIRPGCLIDIKGIPDCQALGVEGGPGRDELVFGAGLTLNRVIESELFAPLSRACEHIADHTVRNRLTLGGNIAGQLPYREALLPLLAGDARFVLAGPAGLRTLRAEDAFASRLVHAEGELLVQVRIDRRAAALPSFHRRRERGGRIDYPLLSICLLRESDSIRMAVSGAYSHPVRDPAAEAILADRALSPQERAGAAAQAIPHQFLEDFRASGAYRRHLFGLALAEGLKALEGGR